MSSRFRLSALIAAESSGPAIGLDKGSSVLLAFGRDGNYRYFGFAYYFYFDGELLHVRKESGGP